jgi:two-component system, chemotaxis family, CheB/CheR fusion protein
MIPPDPDHSQAAEAVPMPQGAGGPAVAHGPFPVVGIGGSAGGIEAMCELLGVIRPDAGLVLLLVLHLDPTHESLLTEILGAAATVPVSQAQDGMPLRPDRAYVIPPNFNMEVGGGKIRLTPRPPGLNMPVDVLFRSMALELGRRAIGVVLSGGGTDGALGVQDIKSAEGITFTQDEESARHDSMPRSASATGFVDHVLTPAGIGVELSRIGRHPFLNGGGPGPAIAQSGSGADGLRRIYELVREYSGVDFSRYKSGTILRRIQRRMVLKQEDDLGRYASTLQDEPGEISALYEDFLIRVTHFFRDPAAFEVLQGTVFPALIRDCPPTAPIRVWVAGCSTGEEVYSLAIALLESLGDRAGDSPIKILATDISERYLAVARAGTYVDNIALDVSPERLHRFFHKVDGKFRISKSVRDLCVFSRHDVSNDPPFARLDLISCRNLLIYLDLASQKRILPLYHYALRPGGHLLLGPSETIGTHGDLFEVIDQDHKIYVRRPGPSRHTRTFEPPQPRYGAAGARSSDPDATVSPLSRRQAADRPGIARAGPVSVLIDEEGKILEVRGLSRPYLRVDRPAAGSDLLEVTREGLVAPLRSAVEEAGARDAIATRRGLQVESEGRARFLNLRVIPVRPVPEEGRRFLALFDGLPDGSSLPVPPRDLPPIAGPSPGGTGTETEAELRRELQATRDYLQSVVEVHEAAMEELRSANEEILSSNEELRSTNEELQTAKEDMQSANEELQTLNDELNYRNREVAGANDDLVNLFGSTSIPIVMVGRDLRVRRFTAPAGPVMNLIPPDVGRPIGNIRPNLDFPDLERRIAEVIASLAPQDHEVRDRDGHWYSVRIRPYITVENRIDGAVIAAVDIDAMKQLSERVRLTGEFAQAIIEAVWNPLVVLDADLRIKRANGAFYRTFRSSIDRAEGRSLPEVVDGPWEGLGLLDGFRAVLVRGRVVKDREIVSEVKHGERREFLINVRPIAWDGQGEPMILVAMEDITDRKREQERARLLAREQAARAEAEQANRKKDEFLALLAHELRNPLAPILNALLVLRTPGAREGDLEWAREIMERQVRHMVRLIDDLLDVSRVMQGKIQLRRERVDLDRIIAHTVESTRPFIEGRSHQFEVTRPRGPIVLDADPVRLEQVLVNLLTNAAKYTEDGGRISVSAVLEGDMAVVRVGDTGVGLSPESLARVFELFMQDDRSLDRSVGGLGIGLTLVKTLVELHGGTVSAHSEGPGRGSEFVVRLPVLSGTPALTAGPAAGAPEMARPVRLLLVEDNVDSALTLCRLLERWGHDVRVAHDGHQGLQEALAFRPEVILLDVGLPGLDGYEVADRLRLDPSTADAVVIALTGYGQAEDRRRALQAGFDFHLVKPIDADQLRDAIAQARERPE